MTQYPTDILRQWYVCTICHVMAEVGSPDLQVDTPRHDQGGEQQVRHSQWDDEVVGGGLQGTLPWNGHAHQHVPKHHAEDEQHKKHGIEVVRRRGGGQGGPRAVSGSQRHRGGGRGRGRWWEERGRIGGGKREGWGWKEGWRKGEVQSTALRGVWKRHGEAVTTGRTEEEENWDRGERKEWTKITEKELEFSEGQDRWKKTKNIINITDRTKIKAVGK